jgi:hypothetical protein
VPPFAGLIVLRQPFATEKPVREVGGESIGILLDEFRTVREKRSRQLLVAVARDQHNSVFGVLLSRHPAKYALN